MLAIFLREQQMQNLQDSLQRIQSTRHSFRLDELANTSSFKHFRLVFGSTIHPGVANTFDSMEEGVSLHTISW
jgi:hypothetical protein